MIGISLPCRRCRPTQIRRWWAIGTPAENSDFSWTVGFTARRAQARADMAPLLAEVEQLKNQAVGLKEKLSTLKKANGDDKKMLVCRAELLATEKSARDAQAKADAIDAATFDLKAVNPRAKVTRDVRSLAEILDAIAAHGHMVAAALQRLRQLQR
jgi:type I restriction enzyme M protein